MSVICQNFVQNAWKKDLCSNCFKSLGDHETHQHQESVVMPLSCAAETHRNGITGKNGTRYISQATTIYQSRGIHTTWTSLLAERQEKKSGFFQLENGFHGKLLTINTKGGNTVTAGTKGGSTVTAGTDKKVEVVKMNGVTQNGLTNGHDENENDEGDGPIGILKTLKSGKGQKANVGFSEDGPLVIGYGGNDYDSGDEHDWECGSDDGDFPIEALDCTDEDRAMTKMTKENTEFNSDNDNLLKETKSNGVSPDSSKKRDFSNGTLPNGTKVKEEAVSEKKGSEDKNIPANATSSSPEINKSQKATTPNGVGQAEAPTSQQQQQLSRVRRKDPAPPQASVKPFFRDTSPAVEVSEPKEREKRDAKSKANEDVISSAIENKIRRNGGVLAEKVADAPKNVAGEQPRINEIYRVAENKATKNESKSGTNNKDNLRQDTATTTSNKKENIESTKPRENNANKGNPGRNNREREKMSNGYRESPQSTAYARKSFLHGKQDDDGIEDEESAIYTPGQGDLFVGGGNRNSSSSNETSTTEDSDSGTSISSATFVCSAELNLSNKIEKETEISSSACGDETTGLAAEWQRPASSAQRNASEGEKKKAIKDSPASPSKREKTPIASSSSATFSAARDDTQSDRSTSPDAATRKTVKFAPTNETEGIYGHIRRVSCETKDSSTPSNSTRSSVDSDDTPIYYSVSSTIIHTENTANIPHVATVRRTPVCHYAESNIFPESERKFTSSPEKDNAKNRESRLAALAQELEQARLGNSNGSKRPAPSPPKQRSEQSDRCPPPPHPPVATSQSTPSTPTMSSASAHNHVSTETETNGGGGNITIYGKPAIYDTPNNGSSSSKGKSATISAVHGKKVLALLNFDESSKSSKKSNKFSIKKFLKRGKDMESLDNIFHGQQPVSPTSPNVKAWKNNDFDRSKMKLEIIHPMDMANKDGTSSYQSTSEMISISKTYDTPSPASSSERSLSTPLSGSQDGIYDDESTWQGCQRNNGSTPVQVPGLTENEDMGSSPVLSTFSPTGNSTGATIYASAPVATDSAQTTSGAPTKSSGGKPIRPPKPPPPPRLKSLPPGKMDMETNVVVGNGSSNVLPPKPQVPKRLFRPSMVKSEYANLGDVRSPMAPKKPERLPNSRPSTPGSLEMTNPNYYDDDNAYELVGVETDSNYNTQSDITDEITSYSDAEPIYTDGYSMCTFDFIAQKEPKTEVDSCNPDTLWRDSDRVIVTVQRGATYERQGDGPGKPPGSTCGDKVDTMAWLSLEQSYAIVAAANHEVLAKLIDQVLNKKATPFQTPDGRNVGWDDFYLQQNNPMRVIGEKVIYDAVFRHAPKRDVTLLVTAQPSGLLRMESQSKNLFLGTFTDFLPSSSIDVSWCSQATSEAVQAQVFILPKSDMGSIQSFFFEKSLPIEKGDTSQFEKELCYIYLQLINALKILQAHGTEDVDMKQEDLILSKDEKDQMCNLIFLSGDFVTHQDERSSFDKVSLCQYALIFLLRVLHVPDTETLNSGTHSFPLSACARKIFITVAKALAQEKASSLSKAKNLLEFHLWGPKDKVYGCLSGSQRMEETLQRWLDIERAQNLRLLIRSQKNITAYEEHQLQFLVRTNSKALKDMTSTLSFEKL